MAGQLFLPEDCSALLPVGTVTQRNVFWRVTAIESDIDFSQLLDDDKPPSTRPIRGFRPARLGLPLAMWAPAWGPLLGFKAALTADKTKVSLGGDGIFLPSTKTVKVAPPPAAPLDVDDLEALERKRLRHPNGKRVEPLPRTVEHLLERKYAEAMLRGTGGGGDRERVTLRLLEYTAEIRAFPMTGQLQLRVDYVVQSVPLTFEHMQKLASREPVRVRVGKRAVSLTLKGDALPSPNPEIVEATPPRPKKTGTDGFPWGTGVPGKEPPFTQPVRKLPRIEIVLATPIVQKWVLLGYERGPLVGSVLLEPGTEASVEVFTFERLRLEREEQVGASSERNTELTALARSTATVAVDTATELGTRFDFGGDASIPVEAVPGLKLGVTGSTETQTAINTNVANGLERVAESTRKSAERFQSTHQVKIVQTTERGIETRSTRKIRNPNAGRTLEFLHFAINERHQVTTQIEGSSRVVACIENPTLGSFDLGLIFAHEHTLKRALLSEDYLGGFAAARVLGAQQAFDDELRKRAAKLAARRIAAERARKAAEEAAATTEGETPVPGIPVTGIYQTARQIQDLLDEFISIDLEKEGEVLADNLNPLVSDEDKPSRTRVKKADARFSRWGFWTKFTMAYPGLDDKAADFVALKFDGENHASEEQVVAALQTLTDGLDDDWLSAIKMIAVATIVGTAVSILGGPLSGILTPILIGLLLVSDDMGLPRAITRARQELLSERAVQSGEAAAAELAATDEATAAAGSVAPSEPPPPQIMTDRELAECRADFSKLLKHLQANATFYQNAIWRAEDPADRFVRLDTMGLAQYVENVLVGFVGNCAMYPLRLETLPKEARPIIEKAIGKQALAEDFAASFDPVTDEIVLPTAAVHSEAYLGRCELLEPYLVDRRNIDLEARRARADREIELARQEGFEALRFEARLNQDPPLLADPISSSAHLTSGDGVAPVEDDGT